MTSIREDMEEMKRLADEFFEVVENLPVIPYDDDPKWEQERRINRYAERRSLANGNLKENGMEVTPVSRNRDECDRNLGSNKPVGAI